MEHLPAFFEHLAAQTTKLHHFEAYSRRTFSDEEQDEMVFFFAFDFHAMITLGRECFRGSCQQQLTQAHFTTLIKVKYVMNIDDMNKL